MRKFQIFCVFLVALLLMAAVGAYAWDSSRSDEIADGVTIGGVDVGGLTADEATAAVNKALVDPLRKKITVTYEGVKYQLNPDKLNVDSDVDGMIDRALEASHEGGLPTRVWRYATGGEVDVAIAPQLTYSNNAIDEFIAKVADEINRDPVDATIEPTTVSLQGVAGHDGVSVDEAALRRRIESVVQRPNHRTVAAPVNTVEPDVTKADLANRYPTYITVDQASFTVTLWKDLDVAEKYTVAVGQPAYPTPTGLYSVTDKQVDPVWSVPNSDWAGELAGTVVQGGTAENPLKARWMGITDGVGFHGTSEVDSLGTAASHGCIRMSVADVEDLYDQVPVGTPVYIG
ncbi:MAG: L,D-transpeptidase ErfK/SrfK [Solirubrobacterales bacterium]|nr:L,D-transpeptidase ErfK/SrfK [Solirubrobacterales bacterium]